MTNPSAPDATKADPEHRYKLRDAIKALREPPPNLESEADDFVPGADANRESIAWMIGQATDHLAEQDARLESLRLRAGQLAGFAGILLGLLAALAPDGFSGLSGSAHAIAITIFIVALLLLLAAILVSLLFVVRPTRFRAISAGARIGEFLSSKAQLTAEPWQLQLATLRAFPGNLRWHAWINRRRAAALFIAYILLASGLLASAVCVATIGINAGRAENTRPAVERTAPDGTGRGHTGRNGVDRQGSQRWRP